MALDPRYDSRSLTMPVVMGMLLFGLVSDKLGRKPGMFITTVSCRSMR